MGLLLFACLDNNINELMCSSALFTGITLVMRKTVVNDWFVEKVDENLLSFVRKIDKHRRSDYIRNRVLEHTER